MPTSVGDRRTIPSLEDVFGRHTLVTQALRSANFRSIVPIMLLSRPALTEIEGIGTSGCGFITDSLAAHGFGHRKQDVKMSAFAAKEFGSVEYTPIAALEMVVWGSRPIHAPLRLVHFLEKTQPNLVLIDLVQMNNAGIKERINQHAIYGPERMILAREVPDLCSRLVYWMGDMKQGVSILDAQQKKVRHLRVIK